MNRSDYISTKTLFNPDNCREGVVGMWQRIEYWLQRKEDKKSGKTMKIN
jgi:hypothetical protein